MEKTKKQKKINFKQILKKNWVCYLFILPMLIYVIIFNYIPMYGIQLAFKDYRVADGIWGSAWVGLKHFKTFFESYSLRICFGIRYSIKLVFSYCRFSNANYFCFAIELHYKCEVEKGSADGYLRTSLYFYSSLLRHDPYFFIKRWGH